MSRMMDREELCKHFQEVALDHGKRMAEKVADLVEKSGAAELDRMLRGAVHQFGDALMSESVKLLNKDLRKQGHRCAGCASVLRFKQHRPLVLRTGLTGSSQTVVSPYFVCEQCHLGELVLRREMKLDEDGFTVLLREMSVLAGTIEPFEEASSMVLETLANVSVSGSKIHTLCQTAGEAAAALAAEGALGTARRLNPREKLYVEIDGGMLHIGGEWREVKVAICFPSGDRVPISKNRRSLAHRRVCATLGTREQLGQLVLEMITPYLPQTPDGAPVIEGNVVVLGDGSEWIRNLVEEDLPGAMMVLDWYHVAEHVAEAARTIHPDNERARKGWSSRQLGLLRRGCIATLLNRLGKTELRLSAGSTQRQAIASLRAYLDKRRELLGYARARNEGLIIGSGAIESAVGHVLQQRMKRSGMRWKKNGAFSMVALRWAYRSTGGMAALNSQLRRAA